MFGRLAAWYNPGYTLDVKTAISLPDPLFRSAERLARRLGFSRSQLFASAVAAFIAEHDHARLTDRLNDVYGDTLDDRPDLGIAALQARSLPDDQW